MLEAVHANSRTMLEESLGDFALAVKSLDLKMVT